jgi:hypothetical protein
MREPEIAVVGKLADIFPHVLARNVDVSSFDRAFEV